MKIPVVITNFNRAEPTEKLVRWLLDLRDVERVFIVDNASTYEPTHELYRRIEGDVTILRLTNNLGPHVAPSVLRMFLRRDDQVIFTDPDLVPYEDAPDDVVERLLDLHALYPWARRVGLSLEIEDLPEDLFRDVREWERRFWEKPLRCRQGYDAAIDTTFALQTPAIFDGHATDRCIRTARPYRLKHVDWYEDIRNPSPEFAAYLKTADGRWASGIKAARAVLREEQP